ncbi:MAG: TAT-variant-translocated molybdopterin oxidoreductase [Myxococcaceae bacterium]|nr:TAT-variant-translocated molybdopterin oxidoreductase [Myxococcaceae bacterium]
MKSDEGYKLPVISNAEPAPARRQWRSIQERNADPALADKAKDEFPPGAGVFSAIDRRGFLQLLGGTAAIAGAAACWRPPEENIYPYTRAPENIPGVPQHYASTVTFRGFGQGVVVESYDGRPIKIEGNELHPGTRGTTSVFEQAQLYKLYDPNRARQLRHKNRPQAWRQFLAEVNALMQRHAQDGGAKLRFLVQPTTSPTVASLRAQVRARFPNAKFYAWQPVSEENARLGAAAAFGQPVDTHYDLKNATIIFSLDSDFLTWDPDRLKLTRQFADRRVPEAEGGMNRLYVAEANLTVTGMNADHRLRVKPSQVQEVARALAAALAGAGLTDLGQFGGGTSLDEKAKKFIQAAAQDLAAHRGRSLVLAGLRQPPAVHALAHAINAALGNMGQTVSYAAAVTPEIDDGIASIKRLADELKGGQIDTLVIDAWNPAFNAPADLDFAALLKSVPNTLYWHYYVDETANACNWLAPAAHELESWGDARSFDGTASLVQPLIAPLFNGIPLVSFWAAFTPMAEKSAYELVREFWQGRGVDDATWRKYLAEGIIPNTAEAPITPTLDMAGVSRALQAATPASEGLELNIIPDYRIYDGSFGNIAWLQELPDPVTKVTWENVAQVSPATAKKLGVEAVEHGTVSWVKLTVRDRTVEAPVYVAPGHADDVITVSLGHGRKDTEEALASRHGFDAYALRFTDAPWFQGGLKLEDTGRPYELAITQDHWTMEGVTGEPRDMALMTTLGGLEQFKEVEIRRNRSTLRPDEVMQEPYKYEAGAVNGGDATLQPTGYKWGMGIDLSRCIACNACVIACQAENNIPIVGKDQVIRAREMHWIMIDRYFIGELDEPEVAPQPRTCQHCETAPCEYVCPVNATVHSDEGLNDMVYNRCVGTRYCSNNCPYKVRRFNYLHWNYGKTATEKMMMNPEVTVRARGVMEKCTYCVQRIERVRIQTRIEGRPIKDGDIVTACQQACPAQAITFGNLNDTNSKVAKAHADERRYDLLYDLGTRPRTGYLTRIKNPNPVLASATQTPAHGAEHH